MPRRPSARRKPAKSAAGGVAGVPHRGQIVPTGESYYHYTNARPARIGPSAYSVPAPAWHDSGVHLGEAPSMVDAQIFNLGGRLAALAFALLLLTWMLM